MFVKLTGSHKSNVYLVTVHTTVCTYKHGNPSQKRSKVDREHIYYTCECKSVFGMALLQNSRVALVYLLFVRGPSSVQASSFPPVSTPNA
jgi:uncharacterized protein YceH (UPF0502 family)